MEKGGISIISTGFAESKNEFLKLHNPIKAASYIIYLNANNLVLPNQILVDWVNPEKFNLDKYSMQCFLGVYFD